MRAFRGHSRRHLSSIWTLLASIQLAGTGRIISFILFTKEKKSQHLQTLNLQHVLRAHLQVMLWKAANESDDITNLGWVIQDTIPISVVAQGAPVPPELLDVIKCQCKAQGKQCSTEACSCHKQHLLTVIALVWLLQSALCGTRYSNWRSRGEHWCWGWRLWEGCCDWGCCWRRTCWLCGSWRWWIWTGRILMTDV